MNKQIHINYICMPDACNCKLPERLKFRLKSNDGRQGNNFGYLIAFFLANSKTCLFILILSDLWPVDFLPDASVSRVLILLFVIPPCITFCTRPLLRPLPSWYSNQQQQHFDMGRDTGCYTLQALPGDCLCVFIKVSLGKMQKKNPHNRSKDNTKPLIPNSLLTV